MGQYWKPFNLDKKECLDPHKLGCGLKLWEQIANHPGTGTALVMLCAAMPEKRGGGDLEKSNVVGRWAGDRIALVGDYAEPEDLSGVDASAIYSDESYKDITDDVCHEIEKALDGKYSGDSWRHFDRNN